MRLWEDVRYDDDDVMIIILARRVWLVQNFSYPKYGESVEAILFSYNSNISIGAQRFVALLDFYVVHLDMAYLDMECGIMLGPPQTVCLNAFCDSTRRQSFDVVGALALEVAFNHVALAFKRRNKHVFENGSSDPSQIQAMGLPITWH